MASIVLSSNTAWSVYNFRHGLVSRLLKDGHCVTIIAPLDSYSSKLESMGCRLLNIKISAKGINPLEDILLFVNQYKIYKTLKPDFIFHYTIKPNIYGSIAARLARVTSIAITTGLGYTFINKNFVTRIAQCLYKLSFLFPEEVWFLNQDDRQTFLHHKLVKKHKAVLLHGEGVDLKHFTPRPKPLPDKKFRFLLIARMLWDKGIGEYIEAARIVRQQYPNTVFQLLGSCETLNPSAISKEQISQWEQEGIIEYLGTADDVRLIIAQADCVVLPSYREGIPRAMIESAAMEKPLITSDTPGCKDVILDKKTGFLCAAKDIQSLAECCIRMLKLPKIKRKEMGEAGRAFMADVFGEQKVIDQYITTLNRYGIHPVDSFSMDQQEVKM